MKKSITAFFLIFFIPLVLSAKNIPSAEGVEGYWMVKENNKPTSIVAVYILDDTLYGKILVSFDEKGKVNTTDNPSKAEKLKGKPNTQGMEMIWGGKKEVNAKKGESRWKNARILDPRGPSLYGAEVYRDGERLRLRGSIIGFSLLGKTMYWEKLDNKDVPSGYTLPSLKSLKPSIPEEFKNK